MAVITLDLENTGAEFPITSDMSLKPVEHESPCYYELIIMVFSWDSCENEDRQQI